ncbi:uncharacterized protein LOC117173396 [Belonocnema kinseyi]|uniref:uncharacterized protein LOC117173396 n=1 Tax=Belonocnema kinseyi TaxID=2817044 RepID=UPI00143DF8D9|nr:uncharacterized protein LOC117173396 [Belonocnema kinseyi]
MEDTRNDQNSENDLQLLQKMLHEATAYMARQYTSEDMTIIMGNTKAGKSTLLNYLIGNKLIGVKTSAYKPVILKKADDSPGPKIGVESIAETAVPTRWNSSKLPSLGIWDLPGFHDNRGVIQDITNGFYISELLNNSTSAKFVIVTDVNDIANDSIHPFLSLLNSVEDLLRGAMKECFSSIVVIFTKVPGMIFDSKVDKQFIKQLLQDKFLACNGIDISETAKDFITFLIKNDQNIGFFYKAREGPIDDSTIELDVITAIKNAKSVHKRILKQVLPCLSERSKNYLHKEHAVISAMKIFEKLLNDLSNICETKDSYYYEVIHKENVKREELDDVQKDLSVSINQMEIIAICNSNLQKKLKALESIDPSIRELIQKHNLIERVKLMEFIDRVLNMEKTNHLDLTINVTLSSAMAKQKKFSSRINVKLREIAEREVRNSFLISCALGAIATGGMILKYFPK